MTTLPRSRQASAPAPEIVDDDLLTVREVARKLRVDDTTVRRWIKSGTLAAVTLPHKGARQAYRVKHSVLNTLLQEEVRNSTNVP